MFLFLLPEASPSSLTELHQKAQKSGKRVAERATRMQIEMALNSLISHQVILQTNDKKMFVIPLALATQQMLFQQRQIKPFKDTIAKSQWDTSGFHRFRQFYYWQSAENLYTFDIHEALLNGEYALADQLRERKRIDVCDAKWHTLARQILDGVLLAPDAAPGALLYALSEFLVEELLVRPFKTTDILRLLKAHIATLAEGSLSGEKLVSLTALAVWCGSYELLDALRGKSKEQVFCGFIDSSRKLMQDGGGGEKAIFTTLLGFAKDDQTNRAYFFDRHGSYIVLPLLTMMATQPQAKQINIWWKRLAKNDLGLASFVKRTTLPYDNLVACATGSQTPQRRCTSGEFITFIEEFFLCLETLFLEEQDIDPFIKKGLEPLLEHACRNGLLFAAASLTTCVRRFAPESPVLAQAEQLLAEAGMVPLWRQPQVRYRWELALGEIERMLPLESDRPGAGDTGREQQTIWIIALQPVGAEAEAHTLPGASYRVVRIDALVQKVLKSGAWSSGRRVQLYEIGTGNLDDALDEDDVDVKVAIRKSVYNNYSNEIDYCKILLALIDHPRLFMVSDPQEWRYGYHLAAFERHPIRLERSETVIEISSTAGATTLRATWPLDSPYRQLCLTRQHSSLFTIYEKSGEHIKFEDILRLYGKDAKLTIPHEGSERFKQLLPALARKIGISGDFDDELVTSRTVDGGVNLRFQAFMVNDIMHFDLKNAPVPELDLKVTPGVGSHKVMVREKGTVVAVNRNLQGERDLRDQLLQSAPALQGWETAESHWEVDDFEGVLTILNEIHQLSELVALEWPEGHALTVQRPSTGKPFNITASLGKNFWLQIGGEVQLDDGKVIAFTELLTRINNRRGNFIQLSDDQFLRLTNSLIRKIETLASAGEEARGKLALPPAAISALNELDHEKETFKFPLLVRDRIADFRRAFKVEPEIPPTLTCTLRPYQQEGFVWLYRLAACKLGACLADDMGLGKTIQLLALLVARAAEGPSLVIAPTSVSHNWQAEARRFAPTLNFMQLNEADDRMAAVQAAQPYDVVVSSYGLITFEDEALTSREWNIIVLDEAQAVKNRGIRRTRVVKQLQGQMRVIATGTPVENNLSELWNLFDFINPGLLGSHTQFQRRFYQGDNKVDPVLKRLTAPFILRRLKSAVLDELPPKTEIQLTVTLDDEERALYESCRQQALQELDHDDASNRITILAHLTKLRRACCHPSLVLPQTKLSGQKVDSLIELVKDLRANNHRALVFSQFVDFLTIVRRRLEQEAITYQYLDGATPMGQRHKIVKDFQQGEGDLFLISLKAGGTGLNLTAANYVILLDPWWNPAVEMQAADRAHRIGQRNPVTVYRLITADTVEERVVELHANKLALAQDLLEGTADTKLSVGELLALFK